MNESEIKKFDSSFMWERAYSRTIGGMVKFASQSFMQLQQQISLKFV
jgi:hypothetical protein